MARLIVVGMFVVWAAFAGGVPDESVLAQWSDTFRAILASRSTDFRVAKAPNATQPSWKTVTDADLLRGTPSDIPKLAGADTCKVVRLEQGARYGCVFGLGRKSTAEAGEEYIRLVRLLEKATKSEVDADRGPEASGTKSSQTRSVFLKNGIVVGQFWYAPIDGVVPRGSTEIWVFSTDATTTSNTGAPVLGGSEIDDVLRSGRYTSIPKAQLLGSSGSGPASIRITNDTPQTLNLVYEGVAPLRLAARGTQTIQLPAGSFRVLGRVSAPNVLPFIGSESYGPGDRLEVKFYIQ